jgi:hypothetical protein
MKLACALLVALLLVGGCGGGQCGTILSNPAPECR